jgi:DNA-binding NarL/FixJ family response regulator
VQVLIYGLLLAAGTIALQSIDYLRIVRTQSTDLILFIVAAGFLAIGVVVGARALRPARPQQFDGNPQAQVALGISDRERTVLEALAAGRSNKEIARELAVSPNTVKTHVARLFEKLDVNRRTEAIARARELGLLP